MCHEHDQYPPVPTATPLHHHPHQYPAAATPSHVRRKTEHLGQKSTFGKRKIAPVSSRIHPRTSRHKWNPVDRARSKPRREGTRRAMCAGVGKPPFKPLSREHLSSPSQVTSEAALPERHTACLWGKERCLLDRRSAKENRSPVLANPPSRHR